MAPHFTNLTQFFDISTNAVDHLSPSLDIENEPYFNKAGQRISIEHLRFTIKEARKRFTNRKSALAGRLKNKGLKVRTAKQLGMIGAAFKKTVDFTHRGLDAHIADIRAGVCHALLLERALALKASMPTPALVSQMSACIPPVTPDVRPM